MAKQATGEIRWTNGVAITRVTLRGKERASFELLTCRTEDEARARARVLADIARRLRGTNIDNKTARRVAALRRGGAATRP